MGSKALFIGGIKSGKSTHAERYALSIAKEKPLYLATTEFFDAEMQERVAQHKKQRADSFICHEEALHIASYIQTQQGVVLVECVSMWINNMLHHGFSEEAMMEQIASISKHNVDVVWVINDVSCSVVSENALVRKFVDINGRISGVLASQCEEVHHTIAGIKVRIQ